MYGKADSVHWRLACLIVFVIGNKSVVAIVEFTATNDQVGACKAIYDQWNLDTCYDARDKYCTCNGVNNGAGCAQWDNFACVNSSFELVGMLPKELGNLTQLNFH